MDGAGRAKTVGEVSTINMAHDWKPRDTLHGSLPGAIGRKTGDNAWLLPAHTASRRNEPASRRSRCCVCMPPHCKDCPTGPLLLDDPSRGARSATNRSKFYHRPHGAYLNTESPRTNSHERMPTYEFTHPILGAVTARPGPCPLDADGACGSIDTTRRCAAHGLIGPHVGTMRAADRGALQGGLRRIRDGRRALGQQL